MPRAYLNTVTRRAYQCDACDVTWAPDDKAADGADACWSCGEPGRLVHVSSGHL